MSQQTDTTDESGGACSPIYTRVSMLSTPGEPTRATCSTTTSTAILTPTAAVSNPTTTPRVLTLLAMISAASISAALSSTGTMPTVDRHPRRLVATR